VSGCSTIKPLVGHMLSCRCISFVVLDHPDDAGGSGSPETRSVRLRRPVASPVPGASGPGSNFGTP
jgi:hypothetical protein